MGEGDLEGGKEMNPSSTLVRGVGRQAGRQAGAARACIRECVRAFETREWAVGKVPMRNRVKFIAALYFVNFRVSTRTLRVILCECACVWMKANVDDVVWCLFIFFFFVSSSSQLIRLFSSNVH